MNNELKRDVRDFHGNWKGIAFTVKLPGWYPSTGNEESYHDSDDIIVLDNKLKEIEKEIENASPTQKPPTERA